MKFEPYGYDVGMPTISAMTLPRPDDPKEFETMTMAAMAQRWKSPDLQKNGRPGQKQSGVDIYGADEIGRQVAIQCKKFAKSPSMAVISKEITQAEKYKGKLNTLFIATSADHDSKLQQEVRLLSEARVAKGKFAVGMIFWDEIVDGLALNPQVFRNFYPQIQLGVPAGLDKERLLAALELGYYGPFLWDYILLILGEFGYGMEDPDQIEVIMRIIEQRSAQLFDKQYAKVIRKSVKAVRKACTRKKKSKATWREAEDHAKRIAMRVRSATTFLSTQEGNILTLGLTLGGIYVHTDDKPAKAQRDDVRRRIEAVVPAESRPAVDAAFVKANKARSGYGWAPPIYTRLDRELRWMTA